MFLPLILTGKNRKYTNQVAEGRILPTLKETGQMLLTFFLAVFGWIIFRAESIGMAWEYFCGMMQSDTLLASYRFFKRPSLWPTNLFIVIMLAVEWLQRKRQHGLEFSCNKLFKYWYVRWVLYILVAISCLLVSFSIGKSSFIYFQF